MKYFSTEPYRKLGRAFNFIIGGREVGKTFNSIYDAYHAREQFIFMRRTQDEIDLIASNDDDIELSPFAKINERSKNPKYGLEPTDFFMKRINKKLWGVYNNREEPVKVGIMLALSTVASIRGFSASSYPVWIFDEFIPEQHVRKIGKGDAEGTAFLQAYSTINRDREDEGLPPIQCFLLSNALDIACPLLSVLGYTLDFERMARRGLHFRDIPVRNTTLTLYDDVDAAERKKHRALYQLTSGTSFAKMAFDNDFAYNDFNLIASRPLKEFRPWCRVGDICIYTHKTGEYFYASPHLMKCVEYGTHEQEIDRFIAERGRILYGFYLQGNLIFENYTVKKKLLDIIL